MSQSRRAPVGYGSRLFDKGTIDGRSSEGRLRARIKHALYDQLGGDVSPADEVQINLAATLMVDLAMFDQKRAAGIALTSEERRERASVASNVSRIVRSLGAHRPPTSKPKAPQRPSRPLDAVGYARMLEARERGEVS